MQDVARRAGVHAATVSRYLHEDTRRLVNVETAERVREAILELGYEPNRAARSLRTRRSSTIGVVLPDLTNPLFPPMVRGLQDALDAVGYTALLANTDGDAGRERLGFETLRARQVEGLLVATARLEGPAGRRRARGRHPDGAREPHREPPRRMRRHLRRREPA